MSRPEGRAEVRGQTKRLKLWCAGWMSSTVAVYIAECSPAGVRGRLVVLQSVLITLGRMTGALVSAVVFSINPPAAHRHPVMLATSAALAKHHRHLPAMRWITIVDYSSRR